MHTYTHSAAVHSGRGARGASPGTSRPPLSVEGGDGGVCIAGVHSGLAPVYALEPLAQTLSPPLALLNNPIYQAVAAADI